MDKTEGTSKQNLVIASRILAGTAIAIGIAVAIGWLLDVAILRSLFPGFPEMKFNTALAFFISGAALLFLTTRSTVCHAIGRLCAGMTLLVGLLTLSEYAVGWNLGLDELLIEDYTADRLHPGRIPIGSAISFLLLGGGLLLLDRREPAMLWLSQSLVLTVAFVSFVVILGYAYDISSLYRTPSSSPVALHGALLFVLLAFATLFARADRAFMQHARAADAGGLLIRRLLPAAILIPPVVGWLRLQGEQAGLYGTDFGLALYATILVAVFSALIWDTGAIVRRADADRRAAERKLQAQLARLGLLHHITRAVGERQDLRSIFQVVVRSLEDHLSIDFCCIALHDASTSVLTVECVGVQSAALAAELAMPEKANIAVQENGLARCIKQGTLVYEPDLSEISFAFPQQLARAGLRSLVISPLLVESNVFGVLMAARRERAGFSSTDCEFLRQLSEHVGLATHQAQLYGALQGAYEDLRNSQRAILQQERLRAFGEMASGIAHDINNALSPISLYADSLLENEPNLTPDGRQQLTTIRRAADDVARTVGRMKEFYRQREPQLDLARVDLNQLAHQVVELTRARWRDLPQERGVAIELRTELSSSLPAILGVETEIRDALTNLIFNAVDAMPDGGTLTIRTRACSEQEDTAVPTRRVSIEVRDTGVGMSADTRRRCMEPFFTTKGERGTGLGLAMVYGMVRRHGGDFEVESATGSGTTVRLSFPLAPTGSSAGTSPSAPAAPTRRLRLLIIDDDPLVLESLRRALENDGHIVATADGGELGIGTFIAAQERHEPYDLVVTDLGMPYVDGRKVAAAIRAAAAKTPIVLLTGWGQRLLSTNELPTGIDRVLSKPPKLYDLRRVLADLTTEPERAP